MSNKNEKHEHKPTVNPADEDDEVMHVLKAYNLAEDFHDEWVKNCTSLPEPLHFQLFDEENEEKEEKKYLSWDEEEASENESIPEFDPEKSDDDETDDGSSSSSDEEDSDDEAEILRWPGKLENIHYRFAEDFTFTSSLMNKRRRKVYTAVWDEHNKPVVIITTKNLDKKRLVKGVPREVRIMRHLRNVPGVANVLGWCPVDKKHYAVFMKRYTNCDMIRCSQGNIVIIRKILKSILQAVHNLHEHKVVHRDLAMDNILWNPIKEEAVIIDFDTACFYRPQGYYRDVGRDKYDAPEKTEMLEIRRKLYKSSRKKPKSRKRMKSYTEKADIYSVGVIFWMLLTESNHAPDPYKLKRWVKKRKERGKHKRHVELDLLFKMLAFNHEKRPTSTEALRHAFFLEPQSPSEEELEQKELYKETRVYLHKMLDMDQPDDDEEKKAIVKSETQSAPVTDASDFSDSDSDSDSDSGDEASDGDNEQASKSDPPISTVESKES